jgi:hypothetical protein
MYHQLYPSTNKCTLLVVAKAVVVAKADSAAAAAREGSCIQL